MKRPIVEFVDIADQTSHFRVHPGLLACAIIVTVLGLLILWVYPWKIRL